MFYDYGSLKILNSLIITLYKLLNIYYCIFCQTVLGLYSDSYISHMAIIGPILIMMFPCPQKYLIYINNILNKKMKIICSF